MKPLGPVTVLAFAPDSKTLVRGGYGAILAGESVIPLPLEQVHDLAFSPDSKRLAAVGGTPGIRGRVVILEWASGKRLAQWDGHTDLTVGVAFAPDGKTLATVGHDQKARLWDSMGKPLGELMGHAGPVLDVAFTPNGAECVTVSGDGSLRVFALPEGRLLRTLSLHTDRIHALAFRPATEGLPICATVSRDRTARFWQPTIGRMMRIVRGHEGGILCLAWNPTGTRLYTGGEEGIVRAIDGDSDRIFTTWKVSNDWLLSLVVSPDGKTVVTGDSAGRVRRFDSMSGKPLP